MPGCDTLAPVLLCCRMQAVRRRVWRWLVLPTLALLCTSWTIPCQLWIPVWARFFLTSASAPQACSRVSEAEIWGRKYLVWVCCSRQD